MVTCSSSQRRLSARSTSGGWLRGARRAILLLNPSIESGNCHLRQRIFRLHQVLRQFDVQATSCRLTKLFNEGTHVVGSPVTFEGGRGDGLMSESVDRYRRFGF
jgi:hypothetical protein